MTTSTWAITNYRYWPRLFINR